MALLGRRIHWSVTRIGAAQSSLGFTLVEALVAMVVITVAVAGTAGLFNVAMDAIRRTGEKASQGSGIESDISRIGELSVLFNACTVPTGSFDNCPDQAVGNSFYYFPEDLANAGAFYAACNSLAPETHLTNAFIERLNNKSLLPDPGSGVTRLDAVRDDVSDPSNHVVIVSWQTANLNPARVLKITPVASSWCN